MKQSKGKLLDEFRKGFLNLLGDVSFPDRQDKAISFMTPRKRHPAGLKMLNVGNRLARLTILAKEYPEKKNSSQHISQIIIFRRYISSHLKYDQKPILRMSKNRSGKIGFEAQCPDATYSVISTFHSQKTPLQLWAEVFKCLKVVFEIPNFEGEELLKEIPR